MGDRHVDLEIALVLVSMTAGHAELAVAIADDGAGGHKAIVSPIDGCRVVGDNFRAAGVGEGSRRAAEDQPFLGSEATHRGIGQLRIGDDGLAFQYHRKRRSLVQGQGGCVRAFLGICVAAQNSHGVAADADRSSGSRAPIAPIDRGREIRSDWRARVAEGCDR